MNEKIIQIIPATAGWFAKYTSDDGSVFSQEICCWALIENEAGDQFVKGLVPAKAASESAYHPEDSANFAGYTEPRTGK